MSISIRPSNFTAKIVTMALTILFLTPQALTATAQADLYAMPEEQVNYRITDKNGILWAKIDGTYPIIYSGSETEIPMVYPTPPETTNISIWLNDAKLDWSNLTETQPNALHHTAIGDWSEILTVLQNVSGDFVLKIHYEHPLEVINGSYTLLYDLNIQEYLSVQYDSSVAHFAITMDADYENLAVNTVDPETEMLKPIGFTVSGEKPTEIRIDVVSEFDKPLPGDLLVSFSEKTLSNDNVVCFIVSVLVIGIVIFGLVAYGFVRKRQKYQRIK